MVDISPSVDDLSFEAISNEGGGGGGLSLINLFSEEEVKSFIWECDNFKSPCSIGVNLGFF